MKTITLNFKDVGPLNSTDACGCTNSTELWSAPAQQRYSSACYVTGAEEKLACLSAALRFPVLPYMLWSAQPCCLSPASTAAKPQKQITSTNGKVLLGFSSCAGRAVSYYTINISAPDSHSTHPAITNRASPATLTGNDISATVELHISFRSGGRRRNQLYTKQHDTGYHLAQ